MDTSEQYIKMCGCPEIQKKWQAKEGDFFAVKHPKEKHRPVWVFDVENKIEYKEDYLPTVKESQYKYIFLPRQDQIQEMGNWAISGLAQIIAEDLFPKRAKYLRQKYTSWEQILLAIYMYDEYEKVWDGKEWIKNEEKVTSATNR